MHQHAREVGRQLRSAEHVQPVQTAVHAPAGLVGMGDRRGEECAADGRHRRLQVGSGHGDGALEGARRERNPGQFLEQLAVPW